MATLKEIADRVGVSLTTVSRVINYDETLSISPEKRQLIFEAAEELNYETPRSRKLSRSRKKSGSAEFRIGLIHFISADEELKDPFFLSIRIGIEKKCQEFNYDVVKLSDNGFGYPLERMREMNGLIAVGKFKVSDIRLFEAQCENLVVVDSSPLEDEIDSVVVDVDRAMDKILTFALEQGFSKIGYWGWVESEADYVTRLGEKRYTAFVDFLEKRNLFNADYVYMNTPDTKIQGGYTHFMDAYKKGLLPELIVAGNDSEAIGIMKAIRETGLRIPDDISIIGMNDIPVAQYTFPALTTVKFYSQFMGETAVALLKERFEHRRIAKKVTLPCRLVIRESCRLKKAAGTGNG